MPIVLKVGLVMIAVVAATISVGISCTILGIGEDETHEKVMKITLTVFAAAAACCIAGLAVGFCS